MFHSSLQFLLEAFFAAINKELGLHANYSRDTFGSSAGFRINSLLFSVDLTETEIPL
jgi:hypothetical protein